MLKAKLVGFKLQAKASESLRRTSLAYHQASDWERSGLCRYSYTVTKTGSTTRDLRSSLLEFRNVRRINLSDTPKVREVEGLSNYENILNCQRNTPMAMEEYELAVSSCKVSTQYRFYVHQLKVTRGIICPQYFTTLR